MCQGRRGELSRERPITRNLHGDTAERAGRDVRRDHRQENRRQLHLARILQSGTPLDFFSKPQAIGARIGDDYKQLKFGPGGYDHNYVLKKNGNELSLAARAYEPTSGRVMEVFSTEPGMQVYSGNFLVKK
jgi:galactose mutarotase-like enzyme